jgi:hypothetical protein
MFIAISIDNRPMMLNLTSDVLHIPTLSLQSFVLYLLGAIVLGTILVNFWKYIVMGLFGIFCLSTFSPPSLISSPVDAKENIPQIEQVVQVVDVYRKEFMDDCMSVAMNSKEECEAIYKDRN